MKDPASYEKEKGQGKEETRGRKRTQGMPTICSECNKDKPERFNFKRKLCRSCYYKQYNYNNIRSHPYLSAVCTRCNIENPIRFNFKRMACHSCENYIRIENKMQGMPKKFCKCGCGEEIPPLTTSDRPRNYVMGHGNIGRKLNRKSPNNKRNLGDLICSRNGRIEIFAPEHPRATKRYGYYIPYARFIMEKHLGRYLEPDEWIEHINGLASDNRMANLRLRKRGIRI